MTTPFDTGGGQPAGAAEGQSGAAREGEAQDEVQDIAVGLEPVPRSRTAFIVVAAILVALIVAGSAIALVAGRSSAGYTEEDKQKFMAACTSNGGEGVRGACGCIYDQMSSKVPYDRYSAIDGELAAQRASAGTNKLLQFPSEVESIRADCVSRSRPTVKEPPISR